MGDEEGFTAGRGSAGEGEADRLNADTDDCAGEPENEDLRLEENGGGFMGIDIEVGVPGVEGVGEGATSYPWFDRVGAAKVAISVGAGLPEILLAGNSILVDRLYCDNVNCPSRAFIAQIWTERSLL